jgi:mannitol 2-dehydrogenase
MACMMYDQQFAATIDEKVEFPNTMVDRVTRKENRNEDQQRVVEEFNVLDVTVPVICESYRQWVIEDHFTGVTRPPFELIEGVQFVANVKPFEDVKVRFIF